MRIRPLTGQILVEVLPPDDKTASGLFLPDVAHDRQQGEKAKPFKGLVVEMGPWKKTKNGFGILPEFGIGHRVLCSPYAGTQIGRHLGERLQLVRTEDVLAIIETYVKPQVQSKDRRE